MLKNKNDRVFVVYMLMSRKLFATFSNQYLIQNILNRSSFKISTFQRHFDEINPIWSKETVIELISCRFASGRMSHDGPRWLFPNLCMTAKSCIHVEVHSLPCKRLLNSQACVWKNQSNDPVVFVLPWLIQMYCVFLINYASCETACWLERYLSFDRIFPATSSASEV